MKLLELNDTDTSSFENRVLKNVDSSFRIRWENFKAQFKLQKGKKKARI